MSLKFPRSFYSGDFPTVETAATVVLSPKRAAGEGNIGDDDIDLLSSFLTGRRKTSRHTSDSGLYAGVENAAASGGRANETKRRHSCGLGEAIAGFGGIGCERARYGRNATSDWGFALRAPAQTRIQYYTAEWKPR